MIRNWLLIGLLAASTYLSRIIGLELMAGRKMSPALRLYFHYVPVGIISALIIKQIFVPTDGRIVISLPVLVACFITFVAMKMFKMFLPSVVVGVICGLFIRYLLNA
ncbi:AzlD domain-containing protein [Thermoactinomyces sp. CICC 10521]|uniref:AzlD domain-containing protein n=1 Tax=Thermoactinomyces sp. CICC 10521 TaxID=2767426 RepID=UPI0018DB7C2B|nr:AzlD domain-containing protein [Thermoactinomyces sp. CICC 10521]MBH8608271.1 AzlD domain-containing protein [Thermoactinomyces sp. CICC 10521]